MGGTSSLWLAEAPVEPEYPALPGEEQADVAVIGAGIVGLTAAHLLSEEGANVILIEADRIGRGVSGHTTAKLSSLHGLKYAQLTSRQGAERAAAYGRLSEAGIARIRGTAERFAIDCDLREKDNFTYSESGEERGKIEDEVKAASDVGLPASWAGELDLPFPVAGAVRFSGQAEFHSYKYLAALARAIAGSGVRIYERSRAVAVDSGDPCVIRCEGGGEVRAAQVVLATHVPFLDRGLFFARTSPSRSYAIAVPRSPDHPAAMYLSTESSAHSIRSAPGPGGEELLIVGGEGHKTGQADEPARYRALEDYARDRFDSTDVRYRWSSHDPVSADDLPLIGALVPHSARLFTATGFGKWGLAAGAEAAALLADAVNGRENSLAKNFDPHRNRVRGFAMSVPSVMQEGFDYSKRMVLDRISSPNGADPAPGSGTVRREGRKQVAVHRDEEGLERRLSARCTHLGCIVKWNDADKSWDCPCHGSRFAPDGEVIEGPAVDPLGPA
jgi:glycine/D-amino acid oxidase-like deaminating enzyme/nitrite reductase/ring-hydroxylating ferredoxin subunit